METCKQTTLQDSIKFYFLPDFVKFITIVSNENQKETMKINAGSYDIVIVGAGLSGLYCAWKLAESGKSVLILEKESRIGGRIYTDIIKDFKGGTNSVMMGGSIIRPQDNRMQGINRL